MTPAKSSSPIGIWVVTFVIILFGLLTIESDGAVLFRDGAERKAAGNYVTFVLWFNFFAGFIYVSAGVGLLMRKPWAVSVSASIVVTTSITFLLLGLYILTGGSYESNTIAVMSLRIILWSLITLFAYRKLRIK